MRYSRFVPVTVLAVVVSALVGGLLGSDVAARQDEVSQQYRVFTAALAAIDREYVDEVPSDRLVYSAIDGMLKTLDPHSSFFDPKSYAQMREKKLAIPFVALSTLGFVGGALTNHYIMFPFMMRFFGSFNSPDLMFLPSLNAVFGLYTKFLIAMGLMFQMPTIVMFLARMHMVTAGFLLRNIKYAVLITFIVSAVITPTADPGTQTLFALPMILLYFISIGIAWHVGGKPEEEKGD